MKLQTDPFDIEGNERARRTAAESDQFAVRREGEDLKQIMGTVVGRRFIASLLDVCGVPTGDPFNMNAMVMARQLGMQEVGRRILVQLEAWCPELASVMNDERRTEKKSDASRSHHTT